MEGWFPIVLMLLAATSFAAGNVLLAQFLGPNRFGSWFLGKYQSQSAEKLAPYECGMPPVGDARERQSVKFYLVAMIFLLFDIEVAFLYPWAMGVRDLRWVGFVQVVVFFLILLVGYVYVWRKGVFDWSKDRG